MTSEQRSIFYAGGKEEEGYIIVSCRKNFHLVCVFVVVHELQADRAEDTISCLCLSTRCHTRGHVGMWPFSGCCGLGGGGLLKSRTACY